MAGSEIVPGSDAPEFKTETETGGPTLKEALDNLDPSTKIAGPGVMDGAADVTQRRDEAGRFSAPETEENVVTGPEIVPDEPKEEEATPEVVEELVEALEGSTKPAPEPASDAFTLRADVQGEIVEIELDADESTRTALTALQSRADESTVLKGQLAQMEARREEVEGHIAEMDDLEHRIKTDPVGFLLEKIPAATRAELVTELLHDETAMAAATEALNAWARDPSLRQIAAAELRADRAERKAAQDSESAQRHSKREAVREIMQGINSLVPTEMSAADADRFRDDAMQDVVKHIKATRTHGLTRDQLHKVLEHRTRLYGIEVTEEGARPSPGQTEATGERLRASVARRRTAAATAPATLGHIPSVNRPPKGATLDEAFKWADQNLASGRG